MRTTHHKGSTGGEGGHRDVLPAIQISRLADAYQDHSGSMAAIVRRSRALGLTPDLPFLAAAGTGGAL